MEEKFRILEFRNGSCKIQKLLKIKEHNYHWFLGTKYKDVIKFVDLNSEGNRSYSVTTTEYYGSIDKARKAVEDFKKNKYPIKHEL